MRTVGSVIRGAVFFDVDGTLVPGTSSSQFLGERFGHLAELAAAEQEYRTGAIDNRTVSILDAEGWARHREDEVTLWMHDLPVVIGIPEVIARCHELALAPYLATLAWAPVGAHLCRTFGFAGTCGPTLAMVGDTYTGEVQGHLDESGKRDYALGIARSLGLPASSCVAVGDSRSDLPLFDEVGLAIAFNADDSASARADVTIASDDLRSILPHLERWAVSLHRES